MMIQAIISAILALISGPDMSKTELDAALDKRAKEMGQALNWRESIVDLLKLLGQDSSLAARKTLAVELGYTGSAEDGSAEKNIWLHETILKKVAEHGIRVP